MTEIYKVWINCPDIAPNDKIHLCWVNHIGGEIWMIRDEMVEKYGQKIYAFTRRELYDFVMPFVADWMKRGGHLVSLHFDKIPC